VVFGSFLEHGADDRRRTFILSITFFFSTVRTIHIHVVARRVFLGSLRGAASHGDAWILLFGFLWKDGNNAGIRRPFLSVRIDEFLSDNELLFPVFQPILLRKPVVEKIRDVPGSPQPGLVVDLIESNVEGGPLAEQAGIAAGVFLANLAALVAGDASVAVLTSTVQTQVPLIALTAVASFLCSVSTL